MTLKTCLSDLFATDNLYDVLGVPADATASDIKRGYRRRSLQIHPDRAPEDQRTLATQKFQALGAVYAVLSDADRRAAYDETGEVDEESDASLRNAKEWDQYWRRIFPKITPEDIANFEKKYRFSDDELADLKQSYLKREGDMKYILQSVPCCTYEDHVRFFKIVTGWIEKGDVPHFEIFRKLTAKEIRQRKLKANKEAKEAAQLAKELGMSKDDGDASLVNAIRKSQEKRQREAESFLDGLAEKYGGKAKKAKLGRGKK